MHQTRACPLAGLVRAAGTTEEKQEGSTVQYPIQKEKSYRERRTRGFRKASIPDTHPDEGLQSKMRTLKPPKITPPAVSVSVRIKMFRDCKFKITFV